MRVSDICTRRVIQATAITPLVEAARLMRQHQVGALVIVAQDKPGRPVSMLTDRDIVIEAVARGKDPSVLSVGDVMSPAIVTCNEDDDLFDVINMMRSRAVRRMPVVNGNGILTGVLSTDDLIGDLAQHMLTLARTLTYAASEESMVREASHD